MSLPPSPTALPEPRRQVAALCWRIVSGRLRILLVTSRETGRWVLPKGWPVAGLPDPEAAAREAWEEAGVRGTVRGESLGSYGYRKILNGAGGVACRVEVFPLKVEELAHRFPEQGQRRRHWFSPLRAAGKVSEPELRALLAGLAAGGADGLVRH